MPYWNKFFLFKNHVRIWHSVSLFIFSFQLKATHLIFDQSPTNFAPCPHFHLCFRFLATHFLYHHAHFLSIPSLNHLCYSKIFDFIIACSPKTMINMVNISLTLLLIFINPTNVCYIDSGISPNNVCNIDLVINITNVCNIDTGINLTSVCNIDSGIKSTNVCNIDSKIKLNNVFNLDSGINLTHICISLTKWCAFYRLTS